MTHTLEELKSGQLIGTKRLKIAEGLTEFPDEIFSLADSLELLDLSGNNLGELPSEISQLKKLKILFFAKNKFTVFPKVLADCPELNMIGFKSNLIKTVPENAFPPKLNWLILTDNEIEKLPKSIGNCSLLQKCALSGNQIQELPAEMAKCTNLELLRVSANKLRSFPAWLFELPKLSWVAFSGNPAAHRIETSNELTSFDWRDFKIEKLIGEGASGFISKGHWISKHEEVAIKVFKGDVTSDGLPEDEMDVSIAAGKHDNLIPVLGKIKNHPDAKSGLIMKLIAPDFVNLGNPPNMQTCTRDTFDDDSTFSELSLLKIAKGIASVSAQLHAKGINHGDLYAHNILVNDTADCLLGDFGAASFYDRQSDLASTIERVEVSAFGCLLEDILKLVPKHEINKEQYGKWLNLIAICRHPEVKSRLNFEELLSVLNSF